MRWGKPHLVVPLPRIVSGAVEGRGWQKSSGSLSAGSGTKNKPNSALNKQLQPDFSAVSAVAITQEPDVQGRSDAQYALTGIIMFFLVFYCSFYQITEFSTSVWLLSGGTVCLQWLMAAFPITAAFWFHFPGISTSNFIMKDSCFVISFYREKEELKT